MAESGADAGGVGCPANIRDAPSHRDPYPYYSRLARQPIYWDEAGSCWVACSAAAVSAALTSALCLTRPPIEPVPAVLQNGPIAAIFGHLVRLNDGESQRRMKSAIVASLRRIDLAQVEQQVRARALEFDAEGGQPPRGAALTQFLFALSAPTIAGLLGIPSERHTQVSSWLRDYGTATAAAVTGVPEPGEALIDRGHAAAAGLLEVISQLSDQRLESRSLFNILVAEGEAAECSREQINANAIGLMLQGSASVPSMAGLTLLALARQPELRRRVSSDRAQLRSVMQEVLRCDPSTSSTIRFMAQDGVLAGQRMRKGDKIIVSIAAANRDPVLNDAPDRFQIDRHDRKHLEFGLGVHACPGGPLACLIAEVAVSHLLQRGVELDGLESKTSYAASAHIRTPMFGD